MSEYLELPTMEVRNWLAGAAQDCGYPSDMADALGWTAWWLENRGCKGVLRASAYLLFVHGTPYDRLLRRVEDDHVVALCPVAMAETLAYSLMAGVADYSAWTHGMRTADPLLAAAVLIRLLDYEYNIHLRYWDTDLILAEKGVTILSHSLASFAMIDARSGVEMGLRLVKAEAEVVDFTFAYHKNETLPVPAHRYLPGGGFRFD